MFSRRFSLRKRYTENANPLASGDSHLSIPPEVPYEEQDDIRSNARAASSSIQEPSIVGNGGDSGQNPLGLNVVYTPKNGHKADIVFVHGLGGTSRWTWSKHKRPELFWPLTFLPLEPDLCLARIMSFGYNATIRKSTNASTAVLDFAKELLFDLKYSTDDQKEDLNIGAVPLLFVVHSMGGLIVKEAYMQGQNDPEYENIVKAISAILFLATPHRGTNLADTLNRLLQATAASTSKLYISELSKNSFTLQKLNEQFRHIAPKLDIVSFYETQPTSIGFKSTRVMILEKDSSVLGYPGETSKALAADHHGVCKYDSPRDPNYITVRNVLKSIVSKIISTNRTKRQSISDGKSKDMKTILAVPELPDVDYIFFQDQWTEGTNVWLLDDPAYIDWFDPQIPGSHILWINGGAATGKSVMASFIINRLVTNKVSCQYFFIRFAEQKKRTLGFLLRSLAYQVAQSSSAFQSKIVELAEEAFDFEEADPKTIWERVFKSVLFRMNRQQPLYWVIDGVDESGDSRATMKLLSGLELSSIPIRLLFLSRHIPEISQSMKRISRSVRQSTINIEGHKEDIHTYICQELILSGNLDFRESVIQRIVEGAQNNFLWVRLAVDKLNTCHTHSDVEEALRGLPPGMEALYDRMALSISRSPSPSDECLARKILEFVACSFQKLTVSELSHALGKDFSGMLDFEQSIVSLCGGFVTVDNSGNISMVHHSAREYLLMGNRRPFSINPQSGHELLFLSCMQSLMTTGLRSKISKGEPPEFLSYSATWWPAHLASIRPGSLEVFKGLKNFLTGHWVLTWIYFLVVEKRLRVMVWASKHLSRFSASRRDSPSTATDSVEAMIERQLLEGWASDFVKIIGKFGVSLRRNPEAIFKTIAPFCPQSSVIFQRFGKQELRTLCVSGISTFDWDDSIARLSFGVYASSISAAGSYIIVLAPSGKVFVYDSSDFDEVSSSPISHGERIYRICSNKTGSLLATYGYKTTKVWDVASGSCKLSIGNPESRPRPLAMLFTQDNSRLLVGTEDRQIKSFNLNDPSPSWQVIAELEEPELEGHFLNSSSFMSFNDDGSLVAVAYRGHPLSAWEVDGPIHVNHCWRARDEIARGEIREALWLPHSPEILGLYIEGIVFKWSPYGGDPEEIATGASRLAMSKDGNLFATGDVRGVIKVYSTSDFRLIYQLVSQDGVLDLTFSPNLYRFYDLRGQHANAWEPNALIRYVDRLNKGPDSDSDSESFGQDFVPSTVTVQRIDSITVLAASPLGRLYCCGTEHGTVQLFDVQQGKISDIHVSNGHLSIERLVWSPHGRYICFSDISKTLFIMSINHQAIATESTLTKVVGSISMNGSAADPILEILFNSDSETILVSTALTARVIAIESASVVHSLEWESETPKWILHPENPTLILELTTSSVTVRDWKLEKVASVHLSLSHDQTMPAKANGDMVKGSIERVLITHDKRFVFTQVANGQSGRDKSCFYFPISKLPKPLEELRENEPSRTISTTPLQFPPGMSSHMTVALAFISQSRFIFASKSFSIISWKIPLGNDRPTFLSSSRHSSIASASMVKSPSPNDNSTRGISDMKEVFSLPGDWLSKDIFSLSVFWAKERSLLLPRNGEVAVIRSASFA